MCNDGLRKEVVEALAPFWKQQDGPDAKEKLRALIARLEHGDKVAMTFAGKHAAKNGIMLRIVNAMLRIDEDSQPIVEHAIAAGHWGHSNRATVYAKVRLPADRDRRKYARDQFVFLMSQPFAGLREFRVLNEDAILAA